MLSTALTLLVLAANGAQPGVPVQKSTPAPTDPRAPVAAEDSFRWFDDESVPAAAPVSAPAPAPVRTAAPAAPAVKAVPSPLGKQPVVRGTLATRHASIDILQSGLPGSWTVTVDGGVVGKLDGNSDRIRVTMLSPGHHKLAIFNQRGTLWSGRVTLTAGQELVIDAKEAALESNDPTALKSDAELQRERLAKGGR